jgi:nitroreductase
MTRHNGRSAPHASPSWAADLSTTDWLLSTTRSVRRRLDLTRPVERAVIEECLQLAVYAPTAEAKQNWRWYVITDSERRQVFSDYYRIAWSRRNSDSLGTRRVRWREHSGSRRNHESARWLVEHLHEVPVLVIPCVLGKPATEQEIRHCEELWRTADGSGGSFQPQADIVFDATFYGSIFPAIWSFQLALRSRGLGSSITTLHLPFHRYIADELGIPRQATQVALLPVAYTKGNDFSAPERIAARSLTFWNDWGRPRADASIRNNFINTVTGQPQLPATRRPSLGRGPAPGPGTQNTPEELP